MDITKILQELHFERERLDEATLSLERLTQTGKRPGRPSKWIAAAKARTMHARPANAEASSKVN
jgi:hypothetical protein